MAKHSIKPMSIFKSKVSQEGILSKETRVTIDPCHVETLQEQYARAHQSTEKEALLFVLVVCLLICGFFFGVKFF